MAAYRNRITKRSKCAAQSEIRVVVYKHILLIQVLAVHNITPTIQGLLYFLGVLVCRKGFS
jgi:hypothetical protein